MEKKSPFHIIIVGAGLSGIGLAHMCTALDISFTILEAHEDVASDVGGTVGLMPGVCRIMDQLGVYEACRRAGGRQPVLSGLRGNSGEHLYKTDSLLRELERSFGYPFLFTRRHALLRTLYEELSSKERLRMGRRVKHVEVTEMGVAVTTTDGEVVMGDLLVGADGVHSVVRSEMQRIAEEENPGRFPPGDLHPPSPRCMVFWGFARFPSIRYMDFIFKKKRVYLVLPSSAEGIAAFTIFAPMAESDKPPAGKRTRKYTQEEVDAVAMRFKDDPINETTTFGDLYSQITTSGMAVVQEHCYSRWHYRRIMTIGDAAHSESPITGNGGGSALEDAAALINQIQPLLKQSSVSEADVAAALAAAESKVIARAKSQVSGGVEQQKVVGGEKLISPLVPYLIRLLGGQKADVDRFATVAQRALKVDSLPVPVRNRALPYHDELPVRPLLGRWGPAVCATALLVIVFWVSQKALRVDHIDPTLYADGWSRPVFLGGDDESEMWDGLAQMLAVWSLPLAGPDLAGRVQARYFISSLAVPVMLWTVEGYRYGNKKSPVRWPVIPSLIAHLQGPGAVAPLYFIAHIATGSNLLSSRPVPPAIAQALIPAAVAGCLLPTALMFLPLKDAAITQAWTLLWNLTPLFFALLVPIFAALITRVERKPWALAGRATEKPSHAAMLEKYKKKDVAPLLSAYAFVFGVTALVHMCAVAYIRWTPEVSISRVFLDLPSPFTEEWDVGPTDAVLVFFRYDLVLLVIAQLVFLMYTVWDVRRNGWIGTREAVKAAAAIVIGQLVVGPAATYAGVWYWREEVMANIGDWS